MIAHVFGDSNMWGDEQPGCSIDENAQPSEKTFPYYVAHSLGITQVKNYAVSGASLQTVSDSVLFNFLPKNFDHNDLLFVYLPNCIRHGFVSEQSPSYNKVDDMIRHRLKTSVYNLNLKRDTVEWMMSNLWHTQALYYHVVKHALTIDTLLRDYKNLFYFWNTKHHHGNFRTGQDGLDMELKHRNAWFPTESLSNTQMGEDVFDDKIIDFGIDLHDVFDDKTIDWDILASLDSITDKLSLTKYKLKHYVPEAHKHYADTVVLEKVRKKLNVD